MTYGISSMYNLYSNYGIYSNYNKYNYYKNSQQISNKNWRNSYQSAVKGQYSAAINETRDYAAALQKSADKLQTVSKGDVFEDKAVISNKPEAISGTEVSSKAFNKSYSLEVFQLAQAQKNVGNALESNALSEFKSGKNEFSIVTGDKTYNLSVNVRVGDTNKEVLDKMAQAINKANAGINAVVSSDKGTSRIELTGNKTGAGNEFALFAQDASDLLAKSGADKINTMTQDAVYAVDNLQQTSDSNIIKLQNGNVKLELKEKTDDKINISIGQDTEKVKKGITDFVNDYNSLLTSLQDNSGIVNKSLLNKLTGISTSQRYNLQRIGINIGSNNTLSIDNDRLDKALQNEPESVEKIIGGYNGLADKTESLAKGIGKSSIADLTNTYSGWTGSNSGIVNSLALKNEQFKIYQQMSYYSTQNNPFNILNLNGRGNFFDWYF
ncbi:MAG: flagellar filament capping protein FliD [bacterium]